MKNPVEDIFQNQDLTREKTLLDVYKNSRKLSDSRLNFLVPILLVLLQCVWFFTSNPSLDLISSATTSLTDTILSFSVSILGFLLSGFTIFATITEKDFFLAMARTKKKNLPMNYLKYIFYIFFNVFIAYFFVTLVAILSKIFGGGEGIIDKSLDFLVSNANQKRYFTFIYYSFISSLALYNILLLGNFIFNVYSTLLMSVRWYWIRNKS